MDKKTSGKWKVLLLKEKILNFVKNYYVIVLAVATLLLPDMLLRGLVGTSVFSSAYVETVSWIFTSLWILLVVFGCMFLLKKNVGRVVFLLFAGLSMVLSVCQYVYFGIFNQFFWLKGIMLAGEGSDYFGYAIKLLDTKLVIFLVLWTLLMIFTGVKWKAFLLPGKRWKLLGLVPVVGLLGMHIYMQPEVHNDRMDTWDSWNKPRVVYKRFNDVNKGFETTGFYQFTFYDAFKTLFGGNVDESGFEQVNEYFEQKGAPVPNEYTAMMEGKNVIAVMMESMDTWLIDETYTPTLHHMMENGIHFTNYNAPFFGVGFTLSSEFAFNTGFYVPLASASASNFSTNYFPYSLAHLFDDKGYTAKSFHFNNAEFYNRGIMHKNYGYERYHSFMDYGMTSAEAQLDSNAILNDAIYQEMIEKTPFYNFVITYSAHLPYNKINTKLAAAMGKYPHLLDENVPSELNHAQILAADTDEFFRILIERLEQDGLLENTVIVGFTDHYAYGMADKTLLNSLKSEELSYRVPAFIYTPGMKPKEVDKPMMTIDLLPTLVNLFGLSTEGRYIGNDILDPGNPGFAYFENWSWLDEKMYFKPSAEEPVTDDMVYVQKQNQRVKESMEINDIVVKGDYYKNR